MNRKERRARLPFIADWRWQREGEKTPWYTSATLLRQTAHEDWSAVTRWIGQRLAGI